MKASTRLAALPEFLVRLLHLNQFRRSLVGIQHKYPILIRQLEPFRNLRHARLLVFPLSGLLLVQFRRLVHRL